MQRKAEAWQQYSQAAILQLLIQNLPALAEAIAQPLAKTEKIVVINNSSDGQGTGVTKITKDIAQVLAEMPELVKALTGIDLTESLKQLAAVKHVDTDTQAKPIEAEPETPPTSPDTAITPVDDQPGAVDKQSGD